ncbi:hypothetical protein [Deinococcus radiotolerans]|nr:hypothetical protein [Deinococcus radiotolerans]
MLYVAVALRYVLPGVLLLFIPVSTLLRAPSPEPWQWVVTVAAGAYAS